MVDFTAEQATAAAEEIAERMTRRALLTSRYDASLARDIITLLTRLERDLVAQIAQMDITGVTRASARRRRLEQLLEQARDAIRASYRRIELLNRNELNGLFSIEAEATRAAVSGSFRAAGVRLRVALPTDSYFAALAEEQLVLGEPLSSFWSRQQANMVAAFRREMELGLQAGETVDQLARRIRGGTRDGLRVRGIMDTSRAHAVALARTSAASVGNSARFAVFEANLDVIDEYVHLSKLDSRTSDICVARAGKRWNAADRKPIGHNLPFQVPPNHPQCRSVVITRVVGGDVPTDQNGEQWVKSLSPGEQNALFGRGRADLYRSGDITLSQLFDQSGRPLRLKDLRTDESTNTDRPIRRT